MFVVSDLAICYSLTSGRIQPTRCFRRGTGKEALIKPHIKAKTSSTGGVLERKREKLLVLGAISTLCDDATAQAVRDLDPDAIVGYYRAVNVWIDLALMRAVEMCADTLKNADTWRQLAGRRDDFNTVLDKMTRGASIALKLLHRIEDHRPSENEKRDRELYRLKDEHSDWSFGQLAMQYSRLHPEDQISDKQAERSYKQQLERLCVIIERTWNARTVYLDAQILSKEQRAKELPTPQLVLDILTTK